jgi:hypothetical protein
MIYYQWVFFFSFLFLKLQVDFLCSWYFNFNPFFFMFDPFIKVLFIVNFILRSYFFICYFFSIWSLFFWFFIFFCNPFVKILLVFNFIFQSKFMVYYFFQFVIDFFPLSLKLIFFSISPSDKKIVAALCLIFYFYFYSHSFYYYFFSPFMWSLFFLDFILRHFIYWGLGFVVFLFMLLLA